MKNKILPLSLVTLVICLGAFLISATVSFPDSFIPFGDDDGQETISSEQYLAKLRNNQVTGVMHPADVINARMQADKIAAQNANREDIEWLFLGPDNVGGRTRAFIFDNADEASNTIIAGAVSGGLYKSTNAGLTWVKINGEGNCLNVSCMTQDAEGTIYVGTGEGFSIENFSLFGDLNYNGAFLGKGIYKSTDGENFEVIPTTVPTIHSSEWNYINKIVVDPSDGTLYVATNAGLRFSTNNGVTWDTPNYRHDTIYSRAFSDYQIFSDTIYRSPSGQYSYLNPNDTAQRIYKNDTILIYDSISGLDIHSLPTNGTCTDVTISNEDYVAMELNNYCYVADLISSPFINVSINPLNHDSIVADTTVTWISRFIGTTICTNSDTISVSDTLVRESDSIYFYEPWYRVDSNKITSESIGRMSLKYSPFDANVIYASVADFNGHLDNLYRSDDYGSTWWIVAPGGSSFLNFFTDGDGEGYGNYANTIEFFPDNTDKILIGGIDMWEGVRIADTGFFQWTQKSSGLYPPQVFPSYVQSNHHIYTFRPGVTNEVFIGHDGGISVGNINSQYYEFITRNKTYTTSQIATIAYGGEQKRVLGGTHGAGTQYVNGHGNPASAQKGTQIWTGGTPDGGNGGACFVSIIDPLVFVYTQTPGEYFRRSEDEGENFSNTFLSSGIQVPSDAYITPCLYWENFENEFSRDSVDFSTNVELASGSKVMVSSNNRGYPFEYILPVVMDSGDVIRVKDIISTKLFLGTNDAIWMTFDMLDFGGEPEWFKISDKAESGFDGQAQSMGMSSDANYLFVGTMEGELFRIANIKYAYDYDRADVNSPYCVVATTYIPLINPATLEQNTQVITSIYVDPQDPAHVIVTLGNYGNDHYVFSTSNGLDAEPVFTSFQGDLPKMPVYSSIIEMSNSNTAIIGTDMGMYISENINSATPNWSMMAQDVAKVPVFQLRQQLVSKLPAQIKYWDGVDTIVENYAGTQNFGVIYAATFGRGMHLTRNFEKPVGIFPPNAKVHASSVKVFPNPVSNTATIEYTLDEQTDVILSVFDINGKMILSEKMTQAAGTHHYQLDCGSLPQGTYVTSIHKGKTIKTGKFIVVH